VLLTVCSRSDSYRSSIDEDPRVGVLVGSILFREVKDGPRHAWEYASAALKYVHYAVERDRTARVLERLRAAIRSSGGVSTTFC
jgi:hypothetical protein